MRTLPRPQSRPAIFSRPPTTLRRNKPARSRPRGSDGYPRPSSGRGPHLRVELLHELLLRNALEPGYQKAIPGHGDSHLAPSKTWGPQVSRAPHWRSARKHDPQRKGPRGRPLARAAGPGSRAEGRRAGCRRGRIRRTRQRWQQQTSFNLRSLSPAEVVSHRLSFTTAQASLGVKGQENGAGRSSFIPPAVPSAAAWQSRVRLGRRRSRGGAAVGGTVLHLPPPPRLGDSPLSSSHWRLGGLGAACSRRPGTRRRPLGFPRLSAAQLRHRGEAAAAPENQDNYFGSLQPHQLASDSNLRLPYLGLFRPRIQHGRILRGGEAGWFVSLGLTRPPLPHSAATRKRAER